MKRIMTLNDNVITGTIKYNYTWSYKSYFIGPADCSLCNCSHKLFQHHASQEITHTREREREREGVNSEIERERERESDHA